MNCKIVFLSLLMICGAERISAQSRGHIDVPDLDGYTTLKCDLHTHTIFSDGRVWPTVRIDEAYREGLDAVAITEHVELRPPQREIAADHNRAYNLCIQKAKDMGILLVKGSEISRPMPPGHINCIFLKDSNPLDQKDYMDALKEAKKQNAFIFWNHPSWYKQAPDTTVWLPEHTKLYNEGYMQGIEVANGEMYSPEALQWALDKNLTMIGSTDMHNTADVEYDFSRKEHRTMTFVFAKERSLKGLREALESRRTAVYYHDMVIGREDLIRPLFEKCISIKQITRKNTVMTIRIENKSDLRLILKKTAHNKSLLYFRDMVLRPKTTYDITVELHDGITSGEVNFDVTNFVIGPGKGLPYSITI